MAAGLDLEARKLKKVRGWFKKNNPFFRLYRVHEGEEDALVYESEVLKKEATPHWKPFEVSLWALCENDYTKSVKLVIYSQGKSGEKFIGERCFSVDEIKEQSERELLLWKSHLKAVKMRGVVQIKDLIIREKPAFLDYLRGGVQLDVMLAIDFTSSNKEPTNSESLHVLRKNGGLNPYQKVINAIVDILLHYEHDNKVSLFGFGGKPAGSQQTSHAFPLVGTEENPWAHGMNGVMEVYRKAVQEVGQSGPTYFNHVIKKAMKIAQTAKDHGSHQYVILTIITDGLLHDEEQTINCLVEAAHLPMSVIIVGVGDADFKKMEIFNSKEGLYNTEGMKVERKLVQFSAFTRFSNEEDLAHEVLKPMPKQLAEYMEMMNIIPMMKIEINVDDLSPHNKQDLKSVGSLDDVQETKYSLDTIPNNVTKTLSNVGKGIYSTVGKNINYA